MPVGSNTDSGSKIRVYYRDTTNFYLAFIITKLSKIDLTINELFLMYERYSWPIKVTKNEVH